MGLTKFDYIKQLIILTMTTLSGFQFRTSTYSLSSVNLANKQYRKLVYLKHHVYDGGLFVLLPCIGLFGHLLGLGFGLSLNGKGFSFS